MKLLLTGATGYIGSRVAEKLQKAGHKVVGLAHSNASADLLKTRNMEPVRGDLSDLQLLTNAARACDGVIHAAFKHENTIAACMATETSAVRALMAGLRGTHKPFIVTSGTGILGAHFPAPSNAPGAPRPGGEENPVVQMTRERKNVEQIVLNAAGVRGMVVRSSSVYGRWDEHPGMGLLRTAGQALGAVPYAKGTADYQWSFVHVDDIADLFVLVVESGKAGQRYQALVESGVSTKAVAQSLSQRFGLGGETVELPLPVFGAVLGSPWFADYLAFCPTTSSQSETERLLGWQPKHRKMLTEISQAPLIG